MHLWGPLRQPVSGFDRPLVPGDHVEQLRSGFLEPSSQVLVVEEVVHERLIRFRDLSAKRIHAVGTIEVEADSQDSGRTWIVESATYSLGENPLLRLLDRLVVNPLVAWLAGIKTDRAFRKLDALMSDTVPGGGSDPR